MNSRLQQFLELEKLTPARLADMLGVQRSGLSHILSGRNKPGYEFLTRLFSKFPSINPDWLLMGRGKPYMDREASLPPAGTGQNVKQNNIPYNGIQSKYVQYDNTPYNGISYNGIPYNGVQSSGVQNKDIQYPEEPILDGFSYTGMEEENTPTPENTSKYSDIEDITNNSKPSEASENRVNGISKPLAGKNKRVKRVIVFYSDGSFEELFPHIR